MQLLHASINESTVGVSHSTDAKEHKGRMADVARYTTPLAVCAQRVICWSTSVALDRMNECILCFVALVVAGAATAVCSLDQTTPTDDDKLLFDVVGRMPQCDVDDMDECMNMITQAYHTDIVKDFEVVGDSAK